MSVGDDSVATRPVVSETSNVPEVADKGHSMVTSSPPHDKLGSAGSSNWYEACGPDSKNDWGRPTPSGATFGRGRHRQRTGRAGQTDQAKQREGRDQGEHQDGQTPGAQRAGGIGRKV